MHKHVIDQRQAGLFLWGGGFTVLLYLVGGVIFGAWPLYYLVWNLLLAAAPLFLASFWLAGVKQYGWLSPRSLWRGLLWLGFLPNSFYLLTDLMHLVDTRTGVPGWYGVLLFGWTAVMGMVFGVAAVAMVHRQSRRRLSSPVMVGLIEMLWALSAVGIYLGKVLRWNTWDVVIHPVALLQDLAGGWWLPTPTQAWLTVALFVCESVVYWAAWRWYLRR